MQENKIEISVIIEIERVYYLFYVVEYIYKMSYQYLIE